MYVALKDDVEQKYRDNLLWSGISIASGGLAYDSLNKMAPGSSANSRNGYRIMVQSIEILGLVAINTAINADYLLMSNNDTIAIDLVLDTQCNGSTVTAADIFQTSSPVDFQLLTNENRFQILATKIIDLFHPVSAYVTHSGTFADGDGTILHSTNYLIGKMWRSFRIFVEMDIPIAFQSGGPGDNVTNVKSNNLVVIVRSMFNNVSYIPTMRSRIRYYDC